MLSDVHGNLVALEAVRKALKKEKPDVVLIAGDLVMNGPEPGATVDAIREMERDGAIVVQGNTDVAVADARLRRGVPVDARIGRPGRRSAPPRSGRTTRSTTSSSPGCAACPPSAASGSATTSSS